MLELGGEAAARHAELAAKIETNDIAMVFCAGPLMNSLWRALPPARRGGWAQTAAELAPMLAGAVRAGDVVVVKGSRASNARVLVESLIALDLAAGEGR
jgi:UDP-N-acetylmuramoyl-tripeptide--D-alanyl-D-alanine ligase